MEVKTDLSLRNPYEVYIALTRNPKVIKWLKFIAEHYEPPKAKILLLYPCSAEKPYTNSKSYRALYSTLNKLNDLRKEVHVATVSEPFAIVPEEFVGKKTEWYDWENDWYDCPGLFRWYCAGNKQPYQKEYLEKSIQILAYHVAKFLKRVGTNYSRIIAFVRTYSSKLREKDDHTHRRIVEMASRLSGVKVELHPPKEVVESIVSKHGCKAWDFCGVAHPQAQEYLLNYLREVLRE